MRARKFHRASMSAAKVPPYILCTSCGPHYKACRSANKKCKQPYVVFSNRESYEEMCKKYAMKKKKSRAAEVCEKEFPFLTILDWPVKNKWLED